MIAIPFVIMFILRIVRKFGAGRYVLDAINLRLPVVGKIVYKTTVARWTRTLGTLISAGVPILEAINITADTAGNEVYTSMLRKVHNGIRQGDTFANPLRMSKTVDGLVVNMIDVGEETGDMDKMLL
jgi:type IV pilus assembly protein PilC